MKKLGVLLFLVGVIGAKSHANVQLKTLQCPTEFEGVVEKIEQASAVDSNLAKIKITFKNDRPLRGADFQEKSVEILKHGLVQVEKGELYSVALRGNRVCDIRAI